MRQALDRGDATDSSVSWLVAVGLLSIGQQEVITSKKAWYSTSLTMFYLAHERSANDDDAGCTVYRAI